MRVASPCTGVEWFIATSKTMQQERRLLVGGGTGGTYPSVKMAGSQWQWLVVSCLVATVLARDRAALSAAVGSEVIVETKAGSLVGKQMEDVVGWLGLAAVLQ